MTPPTERILADRHSAPWEAAGPVPPLPTSFKLSSARAAAPCACRMSDRGFYEAQRFYVCARSRSRPQTCSLKFPTLGLSGGPTIHHEPDHPPQGKPPS